MLAVEFTTPNAHDVAVELMEHGILAKDTHETTIRFAPALVISEDDLNAALDKIIAVCNTY